MGYRSRSGHRSNRIDATGQCRVWRAVHSARRSSIQRGRPNDRDAWRTARCLLDAGSRLDLIGFCLGPASASSDRPSRRRASERPAKAAIRELLIPPDTLPDVAGWADKEGHDAVPGSAKWHFINVPIGDARFDARLIRDENNVVVKIKQYRKILSDRSKPKKERQRALSFSSISSPTSTSRCTSATTMTMAATTLRSGSSTRARTSTSSGIPT